MGEQTGRRARTKSPRKTKQQNKSNETTRSRSKSPTSNAPSSSHHQQQKQQQQKQKQQQKLKRGRRPPPNHDTSNHSGPRRKMRSRFSRSRDVRKPHVSRGGAAAATAAAGDGHPQPPARGVPSTDAATIQQPQNHRRVRSASPAPTRRHATARLHRGRSVSPSRHRGPPGGGTGGDQNRRRGTRRSRSASVDRSGIGDSTGGTGGATGTTKVKEYPSQQKKEYPSQQQDQDGNHDQQFLQSKLAHARRSLAKCTEFEFTWFHLTICIILAFIIVGISIGVIFATGKGSIITDTLGPSEIEDPYKDGDAPHWPKDGEGLKVTIINALSDEWQTRFESVVADWNYGEPNAVDLVVEKGSFTPNCEAPDGKIIVCNGDYGETSWRGVNEALLDYNGIVSTSARMNEYYLSHLDSSAGQYTLCHELGHTFGLSHTDEDFDNEDLGNCMDYTNNLNANKHPDTMNFETLLLLYGPIISGERRRMRRGIRKDPLTLQSKWIKSVPDVSKYTPTVPSTGRVSELRLRRGSKNSNEYRSNDDDVGSISGTVPEHIRKKKRIAVKKLLDSRKTNDDSFYDREGWRIVHRKLQGEEYEFDLGENYKVRIQLFLA